ncbi:MAG: transmembrane 220 family protein [Flavobacteriales bacterium]|jgi:hypothetical protein|nr:transmembrane 220 family protein [Flavobacteriales bacterium]
MKILNGTLAVLFFVFTGLQYNDPDPLPWMMAYASVATLCALAAFGGYFKWATIVVTAALGIWMLALLPGVIGWVTDGMPSIVGAMKAETSYIEETREFGGLLIAIMVLLHVLRSAIRKSKESAAQPH